MSLYLETTQIPAERTAGEISLLLVKSGASQISTEYDASHKIRALRFILGVQGRPTVFSLPVRCEPIFNRLQKQRARLSNRTAKTGEDRAQAERIAWRQLFRWVQAQLALIETGMVEAGEVFMPYIESGGITLYQHMLNSGGLKQLSGSNTVTT
jgi:hypothetical protein